MQSPPPGSFIRFSTDGMSEREALAYWREFLGGVVAKIDITQVNDDVFRQANTFLILPDLKLAFGETSGMKGQRTRALTADGNDDLMFTITLSGTSIIAQHSRELDLGIGQAALLSFGDTCSHILPRAANFLNFSIPRTALRDRVHNLEDAMMRTIPAENGALRLLVDYIALATGKHAPLDPNLQRSIGVHTLDLVALALGATRDGAVLAQERGVRAARLAAMKADILAHLREEGLSVHDIARRHRVTPRYVQMLFDADGMTFSEFVIEQRLTRAHRMLVDLQFLGWTISAIASATCLISTVRFSGATARRRRISAMRRCGASNSCSPCLRAPPQGALWPRVAEFHREAAAHVEARLACIDNAGRVAGRRWFEKAWESVKRRSADAWHIAVVVEAGEAGNAHRRCKVISEIGFCIGEQNELAVVKRQRTAADEKAWWEG
jgi:AraC-like DNA-binding protein